MSWDVGERLAEAGVLPLFRHDDPAVAADAAAACAAAGATAVEITDRAAGTEHVLAAVAERLRDEGVDVTLGAGSVVDAARGQRLIEAGAQFVVSPGLSEEVAERCRLLGVPYVPGCATPSEVLRARALGLALTKIFPASQLGGPRYVAALRAAMPWMQALPTGGVRADRAELAEYVRAGAACVGIGELVSPQRLRDRDWEGVRHAVAEAIEAVRNARAEKEDA
jgi:2-dehydro-3-deoxyphosphogluconate aldolase/(4S)-4-hydroxy-2-oxoglutarate aldolase